jgi:hypothetical protein
MFKQLYEVEFPLKKVALATEFKPVRFRTNPVQNPYVTADGLLRNRAAEPYLDRGRHLEGMIHEGTRCSARSPRSAGSGAATGAATRIPCTSANRERSRSEAIFPSGMGTRCAQSGSKDHGQEEERGEDEEHHD